MRVTKEVQDHVLREVVHQRFGIRCCACMVQVDCPCGAISANANGKPFADYL